LRDGRKTQLQVLWFGWKAVSHRGGHGRLQHGQLRFTIPVD
jgi:predicted RNA binding protein YcfA (HicA-like mRNA interferase family)